MWESNSTTVTGFLATSRAATTVLYSAPSPANIKDTSSSSGTIFPAAANSSAKPCILAKNAAEVILLFFVFVNAIRRFVILD
jgi:hypothetical protein